MGIIPSRHEYEEYNTPYFPACQQEKCTGQLDAQLAGGKRRYI
jgi:hypothetical protein